ncbi:hypothetical protein BASA81_008707 [Batrachochytrium salamandrivorans]|nr:hypothetical protein BASA81_008707 [Batrachochytrium salamandrivorans]
MRLPTPSEIGYALLARTALSNSALAAWLSTHCFKEHKSLYSFCQQYIRDQSDKVFDASEDLYEMNACFAFLCTSPDALETTLEELQQIIFPSSSTAEEGEMIQTDFYRIKREERFGLIVRNVLRVLQCTFEDVSRVYDACLEFKDSEEEEMGEDMEQGKERNRLETRLTIQQHHAYFDSLAATRLTKQTLPPHHMLGETLRVHSHLHRKAIVMQNAVLELAKLHHNIPGNQTQCLMAVREAICVAQQNLDQPVLDKSLELLAEVTGRRSERDEAGRVAICRDTLYPCGTSVSGRAQRLWKQIHVIHHHQVQCLLRSDAWEQFGSKPLALAWNQCLLEHHTVLATCRQVAAEFAIKGKANLAILAESLSLTEDGSPLDVCLVVETTLQLVHETAVIKMDWQLARRMHFLLINALGRGLVFTQLKNDMYCKLDDQLPNNRVEECHLLLMEARLFHRQRALVLAMRSWALANELQLKSLAALAMVEITRAKLEMNSPGEEVKPLLKPALQHLVAHGTLREMRNAQLWEIKAQIKIDLPSAVVALEGFAKLVEREELLNLLEETYYLLARALHDLDRMEERDEAARRCLVCSKRVRREEEVLALQTVARAVLLVTQS